MIMTNAQALLVDQMVLADDQVFVSLDEAPLDFKSAQDIWVPDGDDAVLAPAHFTAALGHGKRDFKRELNSAALKAGNLKPRTAAPPKMGRVVVLPRTLHEGSKGEDVLALQRAISTAGYRKWKPFTQTFGPYLKKQVQKFQHDHGLRADGVYGDSTHRALKKFYDAYGASLMLKQQHKIQAQDNPKARLVTAATWGYNHRALIHYTQGSLRMYGVTHRIFIPGIPYYADCSAFATWCYYQAKLADPNNLNYNGYGYTGTLGNHGQRVVQAQAGDLAFYGQFPFHHVTICINDTMCISHGSEIGPLLLPIRYRGDFTTIIRYL